MTPDAVSAVGGASAPTDGGPVTAPTPTTAPKPAVPQGEAFGETLKVARGASSRPSLGTGTASTEAIARAKQLGLAGGAAAYDVLGHRYARVEGGSSDGRYVNTSGNVRSGQVFDIVMRGGQTFHVYEDRVFRVGGPSPAVPAPVPAVAPPASGPSKAPSSAGGSAAPEVA